MVVVPDAGKFSMPHILNKSMSLSPCVSVLARSPGLSACARNESLIIEYNVDTNVPKSAEENMAHSYLQANLFMQFYSCCIDQTFHFLRCCAIFQL